MQRYDIIKWLINKHGFRSYLEIGVLGRETLNQINVPIKHGVDPNGQGDYTMTSDEFFERHCDRDYDLIFIDGLHLAEQVKKDIENSLTHLNKGGIIILHDCKPTEEWHQLEQGISGQPWTGNVWQALAELRCTRKDLEIYTIDCDWGCGVIQRGKQNLYIKPHGGWTWTYFIDNHPDILNLISIEDFLCGRTKK
jgi:hypothetical protein